MNFCIKNLCLNVLNQLYECLFFKYRVLRNPYTVVHIETPNENRMCLHLENEKLVSKFSVFM
jgi:hypothetical protein